MRKFGPIQSAMVLMTFCLPCVPGSGLAQQENEKAIYRVEINVRELEDGKRVNARSYMMMAEEGKYARIRVGNKVPYKTSQESYQYHDVGMNFDCQPHERESKIGLDIHVEFSSVAPPAEGSPTFNPLFRSDVTEVQAVVEPGKPTVVATMDDLESKRRYEIEVTATKVK